MKRKQLCSLITVALMATTLVMPANVTEVQAKDETSVQAASVDAFSYKFDNSSSSPQNLGGTLTITNTSGAPLDLTTVKLNYYFSSDSDVADNFYCDYSGTTSGNYQNFTSAVKGEFAKTGESGSRSDVLKIGFTQGTLDVGQSMTVQYRVAKSDWSNYDTSNDFGFEAGNGGGSGDIDPVYKNPELKTKNITFEEGKASDEKVIIDYTDTKDAKLTSISGLTKGNQYTVDSNGNVILKASYLNTLPVGTKTLTYKFSDGTEQTQTIIVKQGNIPTQVDLTLNVGETKAEVGEEVKVPVTIENFKGKYALLDSELTISYDSEKLEFVGLEAAGLTEGFEDSWEVKSDSNGKLRIQYLLSDEEEQQITSDGVLVNLVFKAKKKGTAEIKVTDSKLNYFDDQKGTVGSFKANYDPGKVEISNGDESRLTLNVGETKAEVGEEVKVPVTIEDFKSKYALLDNELTISYDSEKLEFVGLEAAGLTEGFDDSWEVKSDSNGKLRIQYLLSDEEEQQITSDGVLVNLVFKAKKKGTANVEVTGAKMNYFDDALGTVGAFEVDKKPGSVEISKGDESRLTLNVGETKAKVGEEVKVPVTIEDFKSKYALLDNELTISYDSEKLEFVGLEAAGLTEGFDDSWEVKSDSNGKLRIQYLLSDEEEQQITSDGVLVNLVFKAKKKGTANVEVTGAKMNYFDDALGTVGAFEVDKKPGSVEIVDIPLIEDLTLDVGETEAEVDEEVKVPVTIENFKSKYALLDSELTISYDSEKLEFVGLEAAGLTEGFDDSWEVKSDSNGKLRIQYLLSDEEEQQITSDGVLVNLVFRAKKEGTAKVEVTGSKMNYFDDAEGTVGSFNAVYKDGSVSIIKKDGPIIDDQITEKLTLNVGEAEAKVGEEVKVPVTIEDLKATYALLDNQLTISYDSSKLDFVGLEAAGLTEDFEDSWEVKEESNGMVKIQYLLSDEEEQAITSNGVLVNLVFQAKKAGTAKVEVTDAKMTYFNDAEGTVGTFEVNKEPGSVEITDIPVQEKYEPTATGINTNVKAETDDATVKIDAKGGKFNGIKGLDSKKYSIKDNVVTIDKSVFTEAGSKTLTFVFEKDGEVVERTVDITVEEKDIVVDESKLGLTVETVKAAAGSTVQVPIYMNIADDMEVFGVTFNCEFGKGATYKKFTKNSALPKGTDISYNYNKTTKSAFAYSVFPKAASGIRVTGDVLFGKVTVQLDADLASGTEIPVNITELAYSDGAFKPVNAEYHVGKIVVE